ncbi:hypothetical protein BH10PSE14_BH10PSE14_29030 [soil metagenome]
MRVSAAIAERIGTGVLILGLMLMPVIASVHLSPYWLLLAVFVTWSGMYTRSRARRQLKASSARPL